MNLLCAALLRDRRGAHPGESASLHQHDLNLRSAHLHVLADAFTSVTALVALTAGSWLGWRWLDPVMGVVGSAVVLSWSFGLLRDTSGLLLDRTPESSDLPGAIRSFVPDGAQCLVIEDSLHTYDTTAAALRGFAAFVQPGGYFVVEDGCVDIEEMRLSDDWPRGVIPAIEEWLASDEGKRFTVRRDLELYGVSCHPHGFLQRVR